MPVFQRPSSFGEAAALPLALLVSIALLTGCDRHDAMKAGQAQMQQGHYPAAVIEFKNAVQEKPESVEYRLALADALERVNDGPGVEHHLRSAIANGGDENVLMPRVAFLMLERNDTEKLVQEFKGQRLPDPPSDADLRGIVAMALVAQGKLPAAHEQLEGAASTPTVSLAKAQLLLAEGKRAEALALLDQSGADAKAPWWILRAYSRLAATYGKNDAALTAIRRAHEAVPWNNALTGEYGEALMKAGQFDQAAAVRDALAKTAPRYFWTYYLDASLKMRSGDVDGAQTAALKVLEVVPDHLPATLIAASAEMQHGDVEMPLKRLTAITAKYPSSLPALTLLAQAQTRAGRLPEAADTVHRGLTLAPDNLALLSLQADIDVQSGHADKAVATLSQIAARDPANTAVLLRLAELKSGLGDKAGATALLDQVGATAKNDPVLLDRLVAVELRMKDVARATRAAEQGVAAMPKDARVRLTLAAAQAAGNDMAAARASTLAALDLQPAYPPALSALSRMATEPAQRDELLARYAKALDASSTDPQTYLDYAARLGAGATRVSVLEKGVALMPEAVRLRAALIEQYMREGNFDKALSTAQSGVSAANAPPGAQALLAGTYDRLGKTDLAGETYRKLLAAFPQRADWSLKVAQIEIDAGQPAQAVTILRSLITNRPFDPAPYEQLALLEAPTQTADALSVAHQMAEHDSLRKQAMILEGDVLVRAKREDDALQQYDKAAKAGAGAIAQLRTAGLLDRMGRAPAAASLIANLLRDNPKNPAVLGFAAQRALAAGDTATGIDLLKRIVAQDPSNPVALNDLAWAQVQAHRPEALVNAQKAQALLPDEPKVLDTLGVAQLESGDKAQAVATLRTASNLAPTADGPKLHLAQALVATGDRKGAGDIVRTIAPQKLAARDKATLDSLVASTKG